MSHQPFELMRWDAPTVPTQALLERILQREGLQGEIMELPQDVYHPETKLERLAVRILVSGQVQFGFPGYGSVDLEPGDILEIQPGVLHDITVIGQEPVILLQASRSI